MIRYFALFAAFSCCLPVAFAQKVGDQVIAIRDLDPRDDKDKSFGPISKGAVLPVTAVRGDLLSISRGAPLWIHRADVIPLDEGVTYFTSYIEQHPKDAFGYQARGIVWLQKKEYDHALTDFSESLRCDPTQGDLYISRAGAWELKKEFGRAIDDYTEALRLKPSAFTYQSRARVWSKKGDADKALADYDDAIRLDPKQPMFYTARAKLHVARREYDKAIDDYTRALEGPRFLQSTPPAFTFFDRARAWRAKGDTGKALADLNDAIRLDPKQPLFYRARAETHSSRREFDGAIEDYTQSLSMDAKSDSVFVRRGFVWLLKREDQRAIADFTEAMRLNPKNVSAWYGRGQAWMSTGNADKAIADNTQALTLDPKLVEGYVVRGRAFQIKRAYQEAVADFSEAIRLNPKHSQAYFMRASAWGEKGEYAKALSDYAESVRLDPKSPNVNNNMAWLLATCPEDEFRDGAKAVTHAKQACELTSWKSAATLGTLAAAYAESGDFENAVKYQNLGIELTGDERLKKEGRKRLALYQEGKPHRDARSTER